MTVPENALVVSIDLDEWYHCRWATGYQHSIWKDTATFFREVYDLDRPRGDLAPPTEWLLNTFEEHAVKATFFILGEVAGWYPELVRAIADAGHEIACHGMHHQDMTDLDRETFREDLRRAKGILEELGGREVVGYRAANLVVAPYLADVLEELGFGYDSSVCPARSFKGKYVGMAGCGQHPYRVGRTIQETGTERNLWELPIPTMPLLRLPACTGIATRMFGLWWSRFPLWYWSRTGSVLYYFHPYETAEDLIPVSGHPYITFFMRNRGRTMQKRVERILRCYRGRTCRAYDLVTDLGRDAADHA